MTFDYVIWYPTWRCNYNCTYCWVKSMHNRNNPNPDAFKEPDTSYLLWGEVFNTFNCTILDINGGEPFIYHGIYEVMRNLECKISITTNLHLMDVELFSKSAEPEKVLSLTVSYHPEHVDNNMVNKIMTLKSLGYPVKINYVAHPDYLESLDQAFIISKTLDAGFNVEPYFNTSLMKFHSYSDRELSIIFKYPVESVRRQIFLSKNLKGVRYCTAGKNRLVVTPDGSIYPCMTRYLCDSGSKIGTIFKDDYKPLPESVCNRECICVGDMANISRFEGSL